MSHYAEPPNDTIFVSGLPEDTTDDQISDYFGQIGVIKFDRKNNCRKIWIYKDKATGKGKGEATITYDDPPTATSAITWFNGKEFRGATLKIELAQRKTSFVPRGGGGGGRDRGGDFRHGDNRNSDRGGFNRSGGGGGRPGDWDCPSCENKNFAYRQECNRCRTPKPPGAGGGATDGGGGRGGGHRGGGGRSSYGQHNSHHQGSHHHHDNNSSRHSNNSYHRRPHEGGGGGGRDRDHGGSSGPSRDRNSNHRRSHPY